MAVSTTGLRSLANPHAITWFEIDSYEWKHFFVICLLLAYIPSALELEVCSSFVLYFFLVIKSGEKSKVIVHFKENRHWQQIVFTNNSNLRKCQALFFLIVSFNLICEQMVANRQYWRRPKKKKFHFVWNYTSISKGTLHDLNQKWWVREAWMPQHKSTGSPLGTVFQANITQTE